MNHLLTVVVGIFSLAWTPVGPIVLPEIPGDSALPLDTPEIWVTTESLTVTLPTADGPRRIWRDLGALTEGRFGPDPRSPEPGQLLIPALAEALPEASRGGIALMVDERVEYETLLKVVYSAGYRGYAVFYLGVRDIRASAFKIAIPAMARIVTPSVARNLTLTGRIDGFTIVANTDLHAIDGCCQRGERGLGPTDPGLGGLRRFLVGYHSRFPEDTRVNIAFSPERSWMGPRDA